MLVNDINNEYNITVDKKYFTLQKNYLSVNCKILLFCLDK